MIRHCTFVLLSLALLLAGESAVAQQAKANTAPGTEFVQQTFSAKFPQAPEVTRETLPNSSHVRTSFSYTGPTLMLMVVVLDMGKEGSTTQQTNALDGGTRNLLQKMDGLILSPEGVTQITLRGHPGRRMYGTLKGAGIFSKSFATSRFVFLVEAMSAPSDDAARKAAEAFVDSFDLKI